ncbi:YqjF family protein [Halobium salinum]|uniref:YqjF family protein n=1 Tax=Halobium salinum TaxID=1364940 RepID=A0ABD5PFW6_9EURY|nr:DUF2071 domain-containing protein [Halobium salinum]
MQAGTTTLRGMCLLHWRVDPERLRSRLPASLSLDVHDGSAWLSLVACRVDSLRPRGAPRSLGWTYPEAHLRTYVTTGDGDLASYLFAVECGDPTVARVATATGFPYRRADAVIDREPDTFRFRSERTGPGAPPATVEVAYRPADRPPIVERDRWLVKRPVQFASPNGRLRRLTLRAGEYDLRPARATVETNDLFAAEGLPTPQSPPVARFCPSLTMAAGLPRPVR